MQCSMLTLPVANWLICRARVATSPESALVFLVSEADASTWEDEADASTSGVVTKLTVGPAVFSAPEYCVLYCIHSKFDRFCGTKVK